MTGQPNARQPRSGQQVKPPSTKALRQLAMTQQRARAASSKAFALSALAVEFGQKIADAQRTHCGDVLDVVIAALSRDHRAAERALVAKLAGEADAERKAIAQQFKAQQRPAAAFRAAAAEATHRHGVQPGHAAPVRRTSGGSRPLRSYRLAHDGRRAEIRIFDDCAWAWRFKGLGSS